MTERIFIDNDNPESLRLDLPPDEIDKLYEETFGFIIDDTPVSISDEIATMTDEEVEEEYIKRFGEYTDDE